MKLTLLSIIITALLATGHAAPTTYEQFLADQKTAKRAEKSEAGQHRLDWWRDARFGMFIHWGPSSLAGSEISLSKQFYDDTGENKRDNPRPSAAPDHPEHRIWFDWFGPPVPREVYDNLHKSFYPGMFDADKIVALAKEAGMKYIVPVAKHCDGFSMWDSAFTDYDMSATPFKRDIIGELAKACEKAGMKFGIYYQQRDWHHPDFGSPNMANYNEFMFNQIKELLERHPNISILWFDAHEGYPWELWNGDKLYRMVHQLRPDIMINDRCGLPGDFYSPEQLVGAYDLERDWESNMTFSGTYSWSTFHKPVISIQKIMSYLVSTAGGNGNLLMNVGPMPTGQIDPRDADRLKQVGAWMKVHGESIYGTKGGPYKPTDDIASTRKGKTIYLHVMKWPESGKIQLPPVDAKLVKAALMTGKPAGVTQSAAGLEIAVAPEHREPSVTTVAMEFDRDVSQLVVAGPTKPISE